MNTPFSRSRAARFSIPVAGSLRYRLIVLYLAACVLLAGGLLFLGQVASARRRRPRAARPAFGR